MDDRLSLLVTYGPLAGFVLALVFALFWRRAAKRARQQAERAKPLAQAEARAERDVYRAEHAVELRAMEQRLEETKEQLAKARLEIARDNKLQFDLNRALERAVEAESAQARLERELADERSRASTAESRASEREREATAQANRIAEAERAAEELRTQLNEVQAALTEARGQLARREEEAGTAATRIAALTQQLDDLRAAQVSGEEVEALRTSLSRANEAAAAEKAQRGEAERKLAEREKAAADAENRLHDAEDRAKTAEAERADAARRLSEQAGSLKEAGEARAEAERRLREHLSRGDQDRVMAESARARIDLLSQELSDLRSARVSGDEVAALRANLADANAALAQEKSRRMEAEAVAEQAKHAAPAAPAVSAAPAEAPEQRLADGEEIARLGRSLTDANNALAQEKSRRMGLESEIERLRKAVAEAETAGEAARAAAASAATADTPAPVATAPVATAVTVASSQADGPVSDDLRHELERLRAENAALARYADGHGDMDRLETAVLRERLQDMASEIAVMAAKIRREALADGDDTPLKGESNDPIGAPDRDAQSLAARVKALSRRRMA
ncbi:hypothetical protein HNS03_20520 [Amorphus sp. 3PC139-8]